MDVRVTGLYLAKFYCKIKGISCTRVCTCVYASTYTDVYSVVVQNVLCTCVYASIYTDVYSVALQKSFAVE
jgi:hypothetical protein